MQLTTGRLLIDGYGETGGDLAEDRFTGITASAELGSTGRAGDVNVTANDLVLRRGGVIRSVTRAAGDAGSVAVSSKRLLIELGGPQSPTGITSRANTGSFGAAGQVKISADELELRDRGFISSSTFGIGTAGTVQIDAGNMILSSSSIIASQAGAAKGSTGNAGLVTVNARSIDLLGGIITSAAAEGAGGAAGEVVVHATDSLTMVGGQVSTSTATSGPAGNVQVTSARVEIDAGGQITSDTSNHGDAGSVQVTTGDLVIDGEGAGQDMLTGISTRDNPGGQGNAGNIIVAADEITVKNGGVIRSTTSSQGDAGTITISTGRLKLDGGGSGVPTGITARANTFSTGNGGNVSINAAEVGVHGNAFISSSTFGQGRGGEVQISADRIIVDSGGTILSQAAADTGRSATGNAGNITVVATESLTVNGGNIASNSSGSGRGGDVVVVAPQLQLREQGKLTASATGTGAAGGVSVRTATLTAEDGSIRTEGSGAEGGRIDVTASDRIYLRRSEVTSSGIEPAAGASVITLQAPQIVLNDSKVTSLHGIRCAVGRQWRGKAAGGRYGAIGRQPGGRQLERRARWSAGQSWLGSAAAGECLPGRRPSLARELCCDRRGATIELHPRRPRRPAALARPSAALRWCGRSGDGRAKPQACCHRRSTCPARHLWRARNGTVAVLAIPRLAAGRSDTGLTKC